MNYDAVSVDGDGGGRQRRDVDADAERHWNEAAERAAERPLLQQAGDGRERQRME